MVFIITTAILSALCLFIFAVAWRQRKRIIKGFEFLKELMAANNKLVEVNEELVEMAKESNEELVEMAKESLKKKIKSGEHRNKVIKHLMKEPEFNLANEISEERKADMPPALLQILEITHCDDKVAIEPITRALQSVYDHPIGGHTDKEHRQHANKTEKIRRFLHRNQQSKGHLKINQCT